MEIPAPVYAALAALMFALTALAQEWLRQRAEERAAREAKVAAAVVAAKVELVKDALNINNKVTDKKLESITKTGEAVHVLVNSSMSAQLKISAIALRRIADMTNHPDDIAAAELAEKLLAEHLAKQEIVDKQT